MKLRFVRRIVHGAAAVALAVLAVATPVAPFGTTVDAASGAAATFVDFAQCSNGAPPSTDTGCSGGWINGILNHNNSHYGEDQVVPQRLEVSVPQGSGATGRTITIQYEDRKGSTHAYDSLATWNYTQTTADRCAGLNSADCIDPGSSTPTSTFLIPMDCTAVPSAGAGGIASQASGCSDPTSTDVTARHQLANQQLEMYGGTITNVSPYTHSSPTPAGTDDFTTVTITYNVDSTALTTGNVLVQLLFGGHLAAEAGPRGWGIPLGASNINGGPYHFKFLETDGASIGNRDNQIEGAGILASPLITTALATSSTTVGTPVYDTATLTATHLNKSGTSDAGGTVTYNIYTNNTCTAPATPSNAGTVTVTNGLVPQSNSVTFTSTGTYYWQAVYSGDANDMPATSPCGTEVLVVGKGAPTITTTPNPSTAIVGAAISDSATVSGGYNPTGTVTFSLYGPNDLTCSNAAIKTFTEALSAGKATSGSYTTTQVGTYEWVAVYGGDSNNQSATSTCGSEAVVVGKASPSIATTPAVSNASVPTGLSDSATVSGGYNPTGTVTFALYGPNDLTCSGTNLVAGNSAYTVTLSGGNASAPAYSATLPGTYEWVATYSGDSNNNGVSSPCGAEAVTVNYGSPSISTTPVPDAGIVGVAIKDTATVTAGVAPTGTVTFALYGPNDLTCSGTNLVAGNSAFTVQVVGGSATSPTYTTTQAGTYEWVAKYNGDPSNGTATSPCGTESVVVGKATPAIATTPSGPVTVGGGISDSATVSGGYNPTGTVTFALYGPNDLTCSSTNLVAGNSAYTVTLVAGAASSPSFTTSAVGTYEWVATYNGDSNNFTKVSPCGAESVVVGKATPAIATTPSGPVTVGGGISDSATVSGGYNPTGTVTFALYGPNDLTCSGTNLVVGNSAYTVTLVAGAASSPSFTTSAVGTYEWVATYNGDSSNNTVVSPCGAESVAVSQGAPAVVTTPSGPVTVGGGISDSATVVGGYNPTGTVTFALYGPNDLTCSSTNLVAGNGAYTVTLVSGKASSPTFTTSASGTYEWVVKYNGDPSNATATSLCDTESVVVGKATPAIATTPSGPVTVGGGISDSATVSGGYNPTGTVTFALYGPNDLTCSSTNLVAGNSAYTVTLVAGAASSPSFTTSAVGTYEWVATYNGDSNNFTKVSPCGAESVVVGKATPAIATTPSGPVTVGGGISDSATVSGGYNPTGTVTFALYGPNDLTCSGTNLVVGNSAYTVTLVAGAASSPSFTTSAVGTYEWVATYNGDSSNNTVVSPCGAESVAVGKATPAIATTPTQVPTEGSPVITDSATVSGGYNPTGTVTFALYGPNDLTCSGTNLVAGNSKYTVTLSGGVAKAPDYTVSAAGTYEWMATYNGDGNNNTVVSPCGAEAITITPGAPTIATTPNPSVGTVGDSISDSAVVSGGTSPTGTVTFALYGPNDLTCSGTNLVAGNSAYTVPLVSGEASTPAFATTAVGVYEWVATYNGDSLNSKVTSPCGSEEVLINPAAPTIATTLSATSVALGALVHDSAKLTGATANAGGSVTYTVYNSLEQCQASLPEVATFTPIDAGTVTVTNGVVPNSNPVSFTTAGTYYWQAAYSGDASNDPAFSPCNSEIVTVVQNTPTIATTPSVTAGVVGIAVSDTATVSGGYSPTGTVTFAIYGPGDTSCTTNLVAGNSAYTVSLVSGKATSPSFTTTAVGVYQWVATYSGDGNNAAALGKCGDPTEQVTTGAVLAATGSTPLTLVLAGLVLAALGGLLVVFSRRRTGDES